MVDAGDKVGKLGKMIFKSLTQPMKQTTPARPVSVDLADDEAEAPPPIAAAAATPYQPTRAARDRAARKAAMAKNDRRRRASGERVQLACYVSLQARDALEEWAERNESTIAAAVELALMNLSKIEGAR